MTPQDPLELLVRSIAGSSPPTLQTAASDPTSSLLSAAYIAFPDPASASPILIPKDAPTRFTSRADSRKDFYTIGQLWLAWAERETGVREYLMKGQEETGGAGGGYVGIADRRSVVDYLERKGDGAGRVVSATESAAGPSVPATDMAEAGPSRIQPVKRKYEVDVADREFCRKVRLTASWTIVSADRKLRAQEIELRDRNSILRSSNGGKVNVSWPHYQATESRLYRSEFYSIPADGYGGQDTRASIVCKQ
jgi:parafibromin